MRRSLLTLLFFALPALAQEFELDLSGESDEPTAEVLEELKPTIAVIGVSAADKEDVSASRARQLQAEFLKQLTDNNRFVTITEPLAVKTQLGDDYARVAACSTDYSCFESAAKKLRVDRVVRLTVEKRGAGSFVEFFGYDPAFPEIVHAGQDSNEKAEKVFVGVAGKSQAAKDKEFIKKLWPFLQQAQKRLATANGKLLVDNADPSAIVAIDGQEAGVGNVEQVVQRGVHTVKVTAPGFKPFEKTVTVDPNAQVEVKVTLEALPIDPATMPQIAEAPSKAGGIIGGLALAAVGAGAAIAGVLLALDAQGTANQLRDAQSGTVVDVTRAEAKAAPVKQLAANILIPAGGVALAGGVTWLAVTLAPSAPTGTTKVLEPSESVNPGGGAMLKVGGRF